MAVLRRPVATWNSFAPHRGGQGFRPFRPPSISCGAGWVGHGGRERRERSCFGRRKNAGGWNPGRRSRDLQRKPCVDAPLVSLDRYTPQHCSGTSTTKSARCLHYGMRKTILSYRHGALEKTVGKERLERFGGSFCAPYSAETRLRGSVGRVRWCAGMGRDRRRPQHCADRRRLAVGKKDPGKIQGSRTAPRLVLSSAALPGSR